MGHGDRVQHFVVEQGRVRGLRAAKGRLPDADHARLYAAGAQLPIFWYNLHENENASGFGLTLKDSATLQTQYYPAFYAYRDMPLGPPP